MPEPTGEFLPGVAELLEVRDRIAAEKAPKEPAELVAAPASPVPFTPAVQAPEPEHILPLTDMGNGERLVLRHGRDIRWSKHREEWLVYDGARFRWDDLMRIQQLAKETVRAIKAEIAHTADPDVRKAVIKHAAASEAVAGYSNMIRAASSEPGVPVLITELDRDPWLLNVLNGTLDLRTGKLRQHQREDLISKLAPVRYDPAATCPTWERFVLQVMKDRQHLADFLQRAAGYALTGDVREQVLFFFWGSGSNGKTTFLKALLELVGDYGRQAAPDLLLDKRNESHPCDVADLVGSRMAICVETDEGKFFNEAKVKQLTGGDRQKARFMRENWFEFEPTYKIFLASNPKPQIRGTDDGIWRRFVMVPFEASFKGAQKDEQLPNKLRAELPGILNWALRGLAEWQRQGLSPPAEVLDATRKYRAEEDPLAAFLAECCLTTERSAFVLAADLYRSYLTWAERNGLRFPVSQKKFGGVLKLKGFDNSDKDQHGFAIWRGVGLLDHARADADAPVRPGSRRWGSEADSDDR